MVHTFASIYWHSCILFFATGLSFFCLDKNIFCFFFQFIILSCLPSFQFESFLQLINQFQSIYYQFDIVNRKSLFRKERIFNYRVLLVYTFFSPFVAFTTKNIGVKQIDPLSFWKQHPVEHKPLEVLGEHP